MRLAFSTLACPDWTWQRVIDSAVDLGYDGVEWRLVDGQFITPETPIDTLAAIAERSARVGLGVAALDTSVEIALALGTARDRALADVRALVVRAGVLGAPCLRVFVGAYDYATPDEVAMGWMRDSLGLLEADAAGEDVRLAVELHAISPSGGRRPSGLTCSAFLARVLEPGTLAHVGVQWDIGNAAKEGEAVGETWRNVRDRLLYLQVKDLVQDRDGAWGFVPIGTGDLPVTEILDLVGGEDFDGWVSFEWEKWWFPEIEPPGTALPHFLAYVSDYLKKARRHDGTE